MNEQRAQQLIVLATFITIGSTSVAELKGIPPAKSLHPHRTIVGGFFAMLGCSIIAEIDPRTGAGLAALVAGGAFVRYGIPTINSYYGNKSEVSTTQRKQLPSKIVAGTNSTTQSVLKGLGF